MLKRRLYNIDLLKIVCIFSVIIIHVCSNDIYELNYDSLINDNAFVINIYHIITRYCVPIFIMISGMFLLDKDISLKCIFKKYILRIIILYIIFSLVYAIFYYCEDRKNILYTFISGYYHLWYLYLLIGLYLVQPILRNIISDNKIMLYFLVLCLIFSSIIPFVTYFVKIPGFNVAIDNLNMHMPIGYVGYFVAGYYFAKNKVNNKIFYLLGLLGTILNIIMFYLISYYNKLYISIFLIPTTVFQSIAIFLFFNNLKIKTKYSNKISYIASLTMGIYLIHVIVIRFIFTYFPNIIYSHSIITIPIISVIVFIVSALITITLKNIPFLKKFL